MILRRVLTRPKTASTQLTRVPRPALSYRFPPRRTRVPRSIVQAGVNDSGGSGILGYDVYVSEDSGPFTQWLKDTTLTHSQFTKAEPGHTYAFYCVATDNVGNVKPTPTEAQTQTTIVPWTFINVSRVSISNTPVAAVTIQFSGSLNLQPMIADQSIIAAITLSGLTGNAVDLSQGGFTFDSTNHTLTWTSTAPLPTGDYVLQMDGSKLFDSAGNILAGGQGGNIQFVLQNFAAAANVQAGGADLQVNAYSVPTMADWNSNGLTDLIVGEKTADSLGKVRVYLNSGTAAAPVFGTFFYAQSNGADFSIPGSGCMGVFPRVFDSDGDGRKDLIVGTADGKVEVLLNTSIQTPIHSSARRQRFKWRGGCKSRHRRGRSSNAEHRRLEQRRTV